MTPEKVQAEMELLAQELETEAQRLAQEGKQGESLAMYAQAWEAKAAAWEAAGKPEYAAGERLQAEQCRKLLASIDTYPTPDGYSSRMNTLGDVLLQLKEHGHVSTCSDRQSLEALEAIYGERGMELKEAASHIFAEYWHASQKTSEAIHATPLVDVVAELRRGADTSADTSRKNRQQLPDSVDARDLAHELERQLPRGGKSQLQIAREFTHGDEKKAKSLLRTIRRFPLLHEAVIAAAARAHK